MKITDITSPENLTEEIIPTASMRERVYYHGTSTRKAAMNIIKNGIQPPDLKAAGRHPQGMLTPVAGKVYITPRIEYAQIYALGGNLAGGKMNAQFFKGQPNGFLFVVPGSELNKIQPDEDEIGEAVRGAYSMFVQGNRNSYIENKTLGENLYHDKVFSLHLLSFARLALTPNQYNKVTEEDEYNVLAQAGKRMVKKMSDGMKTKLIEYGAHIAHSGPLIPSEVWKIAKKNSEQLNHNGDNFFDVAERIA